jgi:hypothetical protein
MNPACGCIEPEISEDFPIAPVASHDEFIARIRHFQILQKTFSDIQCRSIPEEYLILFW